MLSFFGYLPPKEAMPRAKAATMKALEIDDTLAEGHRAVAMTRFYYDWDWEGTKEAHTAGKGTSSERSHGQPRGL